MFQKAFIVFHPKRNYCTNLSILNSLSACTPTSCLCNFNFLIGHTLISCLLQS
nr:MAG TPA: hypothetical protein [Caudoviricetes sp.]